MLKINIISTKKCADHERISSRSQAAAHSSNVFAAANPTKSPGCARCDSSNRRYLAISPAEQMLKPDFGTLILWTA